MPILLSYRLHFDIKLLDIKANRKILRLCRAPNWLLKLVAIPALDRNRSRGFITRIDNGIPNRRIRRPVLSQQDSLTAPKEPT